MKNPIPLFFIILSLAHQGMPSVALADDTQNGFDLTFSNIPVEEILRGGPPRDGIPALTHPPVVAAKTAKYLDEKDWVIGVEIDGVSRAYPLKILVWHENVNDTLGKTPIAVTYCPLCNSAAVFHRNVEGEVLEFGISGLLWNSNALLYDRRIDGKESLWTQIGIRAVTGPAAQKGLKLRVLPSEFTPWKDWVSRHPDTTVLSKNTGASRNYGFNPYQRYFKSDRLMFPASLPKALRDLNYRNKDKVILLESDQTIKAYVLKDLKRALGGSGTLEDTVGNKHYRIEYQSDLDTARIFETTGGRQRPAPVVYTFWFAAASVYPNLDVFRPSNSKE